MLRAEVVAEARRWLGTPFRPKGRSHRGLDCIGLVVVVGTAFDVPHEDQQHYTDWPDPERRLLTELGRFLEPQPLDQSWEGAIGVFTQDRLPGHVGIFSLQHGVRHMIHARMATRRVLEEAFDPHSREYRLLALFGFPGLAD
jgi:hypothetical protein